MQSIRQVIEDAPDFVSIPQEFRHQRIELIIRALAEEKMGSSTLKDESQTVSFYDVTQDFCGCIKGGPDDLSTNPKFMEGFGE